MFQLQWFYSGVYGWIIGTKPLRRPLQLIMEFWVQVVRMNGQLRFKNNFPSLKAAGPLNKLRFGQEKECSSHDRGLCKMDDERYNRIGELIMAYREPTVTDHNNFDVLILDGHKKLRNTATGPAMLRQSVPCVAYDPLTDIFASGGYDGDVVAWKASTAVALETIGSHPKPINTMAFHSTTPYWLMDVKTEACTISIHFPGWESEVQEPVL